MAAKFNDSTLGRRVRAVDFRDLVVAEARYAPGNNLPPHAHDFTYLSLVLQGNFEERVGRITETARSASVVVMPRGVTHGECFGPFGARSMTVTLKPRFFREFDAIDLHLSRWRWFHGGSVARIMLRICREHFLDGIAAELGLSELLIELADEIAAQRDCHLTSPRRCVSAALELLRERGISGLRLGDLAREIGADPAYVARAFRRQMGCTMSQHRRRLWVHQAAHLLASTDAPLGQVALSSGFADQSHLCRVFKAELGLTPQAYRSLAGPR
jgi:AraC family transcriptional regulator